MQVFGLEPILAAIFITIAGVSVSVLLGWLKGTDPINPRKIVGSALIAFIISIQLVIAELTVLPGEMDGLVLGGILFALIAQVGGIDSMAKSAMQAVNKVRKK